MATKYKLDFFAFALLQKPEMIPLLGKSLYMTGCVHLEPQHNGVLCGDMSAMTKYLAPSWLNLFSLPPRSIAAIENWDQRLDALAELCLREPRLACLSGIPIWQLSLLERIVEKSQKPLSVCLPWLKVLVHGGMSIEPYRNHLKRLLGEDALFMEIYAASELGIGAFATEAGSGMRFWQHYGVFYEFEDHQGRLVERDRLRTGLAYGLILSSCSGLWRYRIGDRLVFRSLDPLVLDYVTRDKTTSAFDEKVTEKEIEDAFASYGDRVCDYAVGPDIEARCHRWFLISSRTPSQQEAERIDWQLRQSNLDYDDYRGDGRIVAPQFHAVSSRSSFLKVLGRQEGGQRKFPRLLSSEEVRLLLEAKEIRA